MKWHGGPFGLRGGGVRAALARVATALGGVSGVEAVLGQFEDGMRVMQGLHPR